MSTAGMISQTAVGFALNATRFAASATSDTSSWTLAKAIMHRCEGALRTDGLAVCTTWVLATQGDVLNRQSMPNAGMKGQKSI